MCQTTGISVTTGVYVCFVLTLNCIYIYVSYSDKRMIHWRNITWGLIYHFFVFEFPHCMASVLSYSYCPQLARFDLLMTLKDIPNYKILLGLKQCKSFQLHFLPSYFKKP